MVTFELDRPRPLPATRIPEATKDYKQQLMELTGFRSDACPTLNEFDQKVRIFKFIIGKIPDKKPGLCTIGWLHFTIWLLTGRENDFDECMSYFAQLDKLDSGANESNLSKQVICMAVFLKQACEESKSFKDINSALQKFERLWKMTRNAPVLFMLTESKWRAYTIGYKVAELKSVIELLEQQLDMIKKGECSPEDLDKNTALEFLCQRYVELFQRTSDRKHLDKALDYINQVPESSSQLFYLSTIFDNSFEMGSQDNEADLRKCSEYRQKAVRLTKPNDPNRSLFLSALSRTLYRKYIHFFLRDDLKKAISKSEEAVKAMKMVKGGVGKLNESLIYDALSVVLSAKSYDSADSLLMDQAVNSAKRALEILPKEDVAARNGLIGTLPRMLLRRSGLRGGDISDVNEAIRLIDEDLRLPHIKEADRGRLLLASSQTLGHLADMVAPEKVQDILKLAIAKARQALEVKEGTVVEKASQEYRIGVLLGSKYQNTEAGQRDPQDLVDALQHIRTAVDSLAKTHPNRGDYIFTWSHVMLVDEKPPSQSEFQEICDMLTQVVDSETFGPRIRISSARREIGLLILYDLKSGSERARPIAEKAISLLRKASSRVLTQEDQQQTLRPFWGLATIAAVLMLSEGNQDPSKALEILELGRGVMNQNQMDLHGSKTTLRMFESSGHGQLAAEFESLRDQLSLANSTFLGLWTGELNSVGSANPALGRNQIHQLSERFDEKVLQIRKEVKGLENFLGMDYDVNEMKQIAGDGAIVYIVVAHYCHAIIIDSRGITSKRLADLESGDITEAFELLRVIRKNKGHLPEANKKFPNGVQSILEWLWDAAVGPILDDIGLKEPPGPNQKWKRVWWIPTSTLTLLPLHAAGRHDKTDSNENALNRVVSSYSSSIKALIHQHRNKKLEGTRLQASTELSALLVSMKDTPGMKESLKHAKEEVQKVAEILPERITKTTLHMPGKKEVLEKLSSCSVFHFAGHGVSDRNDPSRSRLLLTDWRTNPLTVTDLATLQSRENSRWLAYLAACSTGDVRDMKLFDEVVHLVNACQVAGFQHVVGSFWEISDRYSVLAAKEFYTTVGDTIGESEEVAYGVHRASNYLRDSKHLPVRQDMRSTDEEEEEEQVSRGDREVADDQTDGNQKKLGFGDSFIWAAYFHVGL